MKNKHHLPLLLIFIFSMFCLNNVWGQDSADTTKQTQRDFTFSVNLYLWAMSLSGSTALPTGIELMPQTPVVDVNLKFSDAVKNLKMAAMLAGRFTYKDFSLIYDMDYVKLGQARVDTLNLDRSLSADVIAKTFNGDFEIGYRLPIQNKKLSMDGYAGTRITSLSNKLTFNGPLDSVRVWEGSKTWVDPIIGVDALYDFSDKWFGYIKGDIGGFGVSSKFTWLLMGVGGYRFSYHWNTTLGFKWLGVNYDKNLYLWDVSQYGFLLSVGYRL